MCPDLPDPIHGNIIFTTDNLAPFELGTSAQYKCYPGYVLVGETEVRICSADLDLDIGLWTGLAPTCECEYSL